MNYFWAFESEIPAGYGFELFGKEHFAAIAAMLAFCVLWGEVCRRAKARKILNRCFGGVLLLMEVTYNALLFAGGNLTVYTLPLHLCAIAVVLCVICCFTNSRWIMEFLYAFGMPGAMCAMLFPDWNAYPVLNIFSILSFCTHTMVIAYTWGLLLTHALRPNIRNFLRPFAFLLVLAWGVYVFNMKFRTNYMFLRRPSAGSPLVFIAEVFGDKLYLLGFFLLLLLVEVCLYLPWEIFRKRRKTQLK